MPAFGTQKLELHDVPNLADLRESLLQACMADTLTT